MNAPDFQSFFHALQHGDREAFEQLVHRSGPHIRRLIRGMLAQSGLQRVMGSSDVWQEILIKFDHAVRSGQAQPEDFSELEHYLRTMAHHKFIDLLRKERLALSHCLVAGSQPDLDKLPDDAASPSDAVATADLLERFLSLLSEEAKRVYACLDRGWTWAQIGAELQEPASTVRIRFARETQRVAKLLLAET